VTTFPWLTTLGVIPLVGSVVLALLPAFEGRGIGRELLARVGARPRLGGKPDHRQGAVDPRHRRRLRICRPTE